MSSIRAISMLFKYINKIIDLLGLTFSLSSFLSTTSSSSLSLSLSSDDDDDSFSSKNTCSDFKRPHFWYPSIFAINLTHTKQIHYLLYIYINIYSINLSRQILFIILNDMKMKMLAPFNRVFFFPHDVNVLLLFLSVYHDLFTNAVRNN